MIKFLASKARKAAEGGGSFLEYSNDTSHVPRPVDMRTRRRSRSVLWRKAEKVKLPETLSFPEFWLALFRISLVLCNMQTRPNPRSVGLIHALFHALDTMRDNDFLIATIVISPASPKPKGDAVCDDGGGHPADGSLVPVSVAQRGVGSASSVPVPLDVWKSLVHSVLLQAVASMQIPQPRLNPALGAMTTALV